MAGGIFTRQGVKHMAVILKQQEVEILRKSLGQKKIVLAGGCFDILHKGHIAFLNAAKSHGDILIVLLESDAFISQKKGKRRPFHTQKIRAAILSSLRSVEYIILLDKMLQDYEYDRLVVLLKPAIIATTKDDPYKRHKERQAKLLNATVREVIETLPTQSTSTLGKHL